MTATTVTVTGTCTGCGGGSGSFTSYTNFLNQTISSTDGARPIFVEINSTGSIIGETASQIELSLKSNGNNVFVYQEPGLTAFDVKLGTMMAQTSDGRYIAVVNQTTNTISVWKSHSLLQNIGIDTTEFTLSGGKLSNNFGAIGISSDGKYITWLGVDSSGTINRIIVFQGS